MTSINDNYDSNENMTSNVDKLSQRRRERRNRRKERSTSTLQGMFQETETSAPAAPPSTMIVPPCAHDGDIQVEEHCREQNMTRRSPSPSSVDKYSEAERLELLEMTRKLRQAKRRLFLKSAARPTDSVTQLRQILLQISFDESMSAMPLSTPPPSPQSSLSSLLEQPQEGAIEV